MNILKKYLNFFLSIAFIFSITQVKLIPGLINSKTTNKKEESGNEKDRKNKLQSKLISSLSRITYCTKATEFTKRLNKIKTLFENGANPNIKDVNGKTPFHSFCEYNYRANKKVIKLLFKNGANPNIKDKDGDTPFHYICQYNYEANQEVIKLFFENGANPNIENKNGNTPFSIIIQREDLKKDTLRDIVKLFIDNGVNLNQKNKNELTLLHYICYKNLVSLNTKILQRYLDEGGNLNEKETSTGLTLFQSICEMENLNSEILKLCIKNGGNLNVENNDKKTPFHLICRDPKLNLETLELCISNGGDLNLKDNDGNTPFHLICKNKNLNLEIFKLCIDNGGDLNVENNKKNTPQKYLIFDKNNLQTNLVQYIIENKFFNLNDELEIEVDQNLTLKLTYFLLFSGQRNMTINIFKQCFEKGANPNITNNVILTSALDGMISESILNGKKKINEQTKIIELFLDNGATSLIEQKLFEEYNIDGKVLKKLENFYENNKIFKKIKIQSEAILKDFNKLHREKLLTDDRIRNIKYHRLLLMARLGKPLDQLNNVKTILLKKEYKNNLEDFFKWIYGYKLSDLNFEKVLLILEDLGINHPKHCVEGLKQMMKRLYTNESKYPKDFTINLNRKGSKNVKVHKIILIARSGLFRKMFKNIEDTNIKEVLDYSKKSCKAMEIIVKYLYAGNLFEEDIYTHIYDDEDKTVKLIIPEKLQDELEDASEYYQLSGANNIFDCFIKENLN